MSSSKQVCQPYNFLLSSFLGHGGCVNSLIICIEIEQQMREKLKLRNRKWVFCLSDNFHLKQFYDWLDLTSCSRSICHIGILWRNELHSLETVPAGGIFLLSIEISCRHACITSLASFGIEENETWHQVHNSGLVSEYFYQWGWTDASFFSFLLYQGQIHLQPIPKPKTGQMCHTERSYCDVLEHDSCDGNFITFRAWTCQECGVCFLLQFNLPFFICHENFVWHFCQDHFKLDVK
jgi:hypothetical protein